MITGIQYLKDCLGILPFLILTFSGIIILLGTAGSNVGNREKFGSGVAIAGCVFSMLCLILFRYPANKVLFNGMLYVDNFSVFLIFMLLIATLIVVLISRNAITYEGIGIGEYYALLVFSTAGMILMVQAAHLIMVFLA
jgi:NADH-quinone oxidoreductase subunit N